MTLSKGHFGVRGAHHRKEGNGDPLLIPCLATYHPFMDDFWAKSFFFPYMDGVSVQREFWNILKFEGFLVILRGKFS